MITRFQAFVYCLILACLTFALGAIVGYFTHPGIPAQPSEDLSIQGKLMSEISNENIRENLRFLTSKPHIAGRSRDEVDLVYFIKEKWTESGLDSIVVYPYDVLLSYPVQGDSNYVAVLDETGAESDISQRKELVIDPEQNDPDVVDPFNAYSPPGDPEGELVYVNFGRIEDFIELNRTLNIETEGKICIARYGQIFRGDKAQNAELYGCAGLILYSDPSQYTVPWSGVYPEDWYLPPTGVQRGTLCLDDGDLSTPSYPSISTAWRKPDKDLILPRIPVTPIGYIDAVKYLEKMRGNEVRDEWKGGLNITYRYGPGFAAPYNTSRTKMHVTTHNEVATTRNVIGYIRGAVEPDRYVLFGNHRDAWVFGAIDPSSGTAALIEVVRAFGEMVKQGWRPRRTLVFCSWGAEEYGLIGSTEWVEQFQKELQSRAVVYLNVDISVMGNYSFQGRGVSSFKQIVYDATKLVSNPDPEEMSAGRLTVYDTWIKRMKDSIFDTPSFPSLGSGSDYVPFQHVIGVSSVDLRFTNDESTGIALYPVYHSVYETFELMSKFVDPDFAFHGALTKIWAEVGRRLSDSVVLPIDCQLYADDLKVKRDDFETKFAVDMENHGIDLNQLDNAVAIFHKAADEFHKRKMKITDSFNEIRMVNDQLMQLERAFVGINPLTGRESFRHVIAAPSWHDSYDTAAFPGLTDAMFDIDADPDQDGRWDEVKRQYSFLIFHILSAAATLGPVVPE